MMFNHLLTALVLGVLLIGQGVFAQIQQEKPRADWAIYVERQDGANFQFLVYQKDDHIGGAALSRLPRPAGWETPPDKLPVAGVNLMAYWENSVVQVKVAVVYDDMELTDDRPKYGNKEEPLTEFQLPQGQTVVIKELERVGLLPITLRLVPAKPDKPRRVVPLAFPQAVSKVAGLEVLSLEKLSAGMGGPENDFATRYEATLLNATGKTIVYLEADRDAPFCHCMAAGEGEGTLRFESGAKYKMRLWIAHPQIGGFGSSEEELKRPFTFTIVTAVFADGSYIGEPQRVAQRVAYWRGAEIQIKLLRPLLDRLLQSAANDLDKAVAEFLKESELLRIDPAPEEVERIMARFPRLKREEVKRDLQLALAAGKVFRDEIEFNYRLAREDTKNFTREAFVAWLKREMEGRIYHRKIQNQ